MTSETDLIRVGSVVELQAALRQGAWRLMSGRGGTTVLLPEGEFLLPDSKLTIPQGVTLTGRGGHTRLVGTLTVYGHVSDLKVLGQVKLWANGGSQPLVGTCSLHRVIATNHGRAPALVVLFDPAGSFGVYLMRNEFYADHDVVMELPARWGPAAVEFLSYHNLFESWRQETPGSYAVDLAGVPAIWNQWIAPTINTSGTSGGVFRAKTGNGGYYLTRPHATYQNGRNRVEATGTGTLRVQYPTGASQPHQPLEFVGACAVES